MLRFIFLILSLGSSHIFASPNYSKEVEKFAETLIFNKYQATFELTEEQKLYIKANPISDRMTFTECTIPLEGYIVGDKIKSKTAVKVSCKDDTPWDLYVRVKVQTLIPLIVSSRPLSKGETLDEENIELIYKAKSQVRGSTFSELALLNGVRLKRNVSSQRGIRFKDVCYVCKGDKVTITANQSGLKIKASGIALTDGNIGSTVRVKNTRTQREVVGTVYALKEVQVSF
ncbi:flagella basal body P-ring formation protein FlgA [Psychromonas sp. B3M02]|uniref:flagellar basal body P-ring formation chaperone FlgA n=1 Tax=Psychromonas sp. KJ10-2 TaxID=3391822 RepID=UPI000DEA6BDE|nr:flagella basal body P-ring formation protein FlgA [Psychromonas sp. B3M02]